MPSFRNGVVYLDRLVDLSRFLNAEVNAVLMYHSIGGDGFGAVNVSRFRSDLEYLRERYKLVDLPDVFDDHLPVDRGAAMSWDHVHIGTDEFEDYFKANGTE